MFEYLEQLRQKPIYYRKRVATITTVAITVVIVLIWLSTLNFGTAEKIDSQNVAEALKPLQQIKASVVDFYSSVKEMSSALFEAATTSTSTPNNSTL